jgi:hypothetical protein
MEARWLARMAYSHINDTLAVSFLFVDRRWGIEVASGTDAGWRALNKQHLRAVCSPERHSLASECAACKAYSHI